MPFYSYWQYGSSYFINTSVILGRIILWSWSSHTFHATMSLAASEDLKVGKAPKFKCYGPDLLLVYVDQWSDDNLHYLRIWPYILVLSYEVFSLFSHSTFGFCLLYNSTSDILRTYSVLIHWTKLPFKQMVKQLKYKEAQDYLSFFRTRTYMQRSPNRGVSKAQYATI